MQTVTRSLMVLSLPLVLSSLLGACIVVPEHAHRGGGEVVVHMPAPRVEVVAVAPPPPRVEVIGVAPSLAHFWVGGYWGWHGGHHDWVPGHWESHRAGHRYVPHQWVQEGPGWRMLPGHWEAR
jgi:hypothetical protein